VSVLPFLHRIVLLGSDLKADFAEEFNPHGIGLWIGKNGKSLFVVNHRQDGHFVEIFGFKDNRLIHRESIGLM